jgi:hypothetical protein
LISHRHVALVHIEVICFRMRVSHSSGATFDLSARQLVREDDQLSQVGAASMIERIVQRELRFPKLALFFLILLMFAISFIQT